MLDLFIRTITFESGEQFPMLIDRETGIPLFHPTVYQVSMRRSKGSATATLVRDLQAIMFLYRWGQKNGIDVEMRFRTHDFLSLHEIDSLAQEAWTPLDEVLDNAVKGAGPEVRQRSMTTLSRYRKKLKHQKFKPVAPDTMGVRLAYVRDYLDWLALQRLSRLNKSSGDYAALDSARQQMRQAIDARIPSGQGKGTGNPDGSQMGLEKSQQKRLLEVIDPGSPENPWQGSHTRERNRLLTLILLLLGLRRGEALGLKVADFDFQQATVTVHLSPDDIHDPRQQKPQAKTRARLLGLSPELCKLCRDYVIKHRSRLSGVRLHPFLFVEGKGGAPLSIPGCNTVFLSLRNKIPDMPRDFSAHTLRHTWNDRFSEKADELIRKGAWTIEDEKKARTEAMGWEPNSGMAAVYARRHARERAREALVEMQSALLGETEE